MNFFKKLFGIGNQNPMTGDSQISVNLVISEDLFVDNQPPRVQEKPAPVSALMQFLRADYLGEGFRNGYALHSADALESALRHLKAEFRLIVDEVINKHKQEMSAIRQQIIATSGISGRLQSQLELRVQSLNEIVLQLEKAKELSIDDEGLIAKPVHCYRDGFLKGLAQYHEERFIAPSTGMFN